MSETMRVVHLVEVALPVVAVGAYAYTRTNHSARHDGARVAVHRLGVVAGIAFAVIVVLILIAYAVLIGSGGIG